MYTDRSWVILVYRKYTTIEQDIYMRSIYCVHLHVVTKTDKKLQKHICSAIQGEDVDMLFQKQMTRIFESVEIENHA